MEDCACGYCGKDNGLGFEILGPCLKCLDKGVKLFCQLDDGTVLYQHEHDGKVEVRRFNPHF